MQRSRKEAIKKCLMWGIYYSGLYLLLRSLAAKRFGVIILAYHKIDDPRAGGFSSTLGVSAAQFERQLRYLQKRGQAVSMSEACRMLVAGEPLVQDYFVVSCDDGYANIFDYGMPIFEKYGIKPIIYLPTGFIDGQDLLWHDKVELIARYCRQERVILRELGIDMRLRHNRDRADLAYALMQGIKHLPAGDRDERIASLAVELGTSVALNIKEMLTWRQISQMAEWGVEFGAHTVTHQILSSAAKEEAGMELVESKRSIETHLNTEANHFAYPDGKIVHIDAGIKAMVRNVFASAVTTDPGVNFPGCDLFRLKRIGVIREMDPAYLKVKILLARLLARRGNE